MKYVSPRFFLDKWPTLRKHLRNFIISGKFVGGDASFWDAYYINRRNCSEGKAKKAYVTPLVEAEGVLEMKLNPVWFNVEDMVQVALVNCDEIDPSPSASCCSLIKKMGSVDSFTILASNQRFRSPKRLRGFWAWLRRKQLSVRASKKWCTWVWSLACKWKSMKCIVEIEWKPSDQQWSTWSKVTLPDIFWKDSSNDTRNTHTSKFQMDTKHSRN